MLQAHDDRIQQTQQLGTLLDSHILYEDIIDMKI